MSQKTKCCSVPYHFKGIQVCGRKVIETDFIVTDYKKELIKVITHLSNEFIREKRDDVFKLVSAIDYYNTVEYNVQTEHNFRFMLCHIDRALYRKEM